METKRDRTGVTFGGQGEPMQIGSLKGNCYNCKKSGHFARDCPLGQKASDRYLRSLTSDELAWLDHSLQKLPDRSLQKRWELEGMVSYMGISVSRGIGSGSSQRI